MRNAQLELKKLRLELALAALDDADKALGKSAPIKRIRCKVFAPGNKSFETLYVEAPHSKAFSAKGLDKAIQRAAEAVEAKYPGQDYRMVKTKDSYNFVWVQETPPEPVRMESFSNLDASLEDVQ